ncbi:hypothetical protein [Sulfobacillus harzensis]|uniref:RnfABCDGE type electron transport complex subunit D n=1 Tax=Sulfobacillus harzensis TaxID=2729629 RepID=A0A7Y0Q3E0_9FIRM|nr:hypothetical protein [Sulfobacillus harzensis]NMP22099.1 RnfABCDGE type electron transport complex subunit D [Sulfobacillus harzensis]
MSKQGKQTPITSTWKSFRRFAKTPKGHVLGALIVLTLIGGFFPAGHLGILHAIAAGATAIVFDAMVAWVLKRKVTFSTGGLITGLIIADVLSGLAPIAIVMLTTMVALASKHLLKRGRKPIFNPAAVGLLVSIGVFSTAESWWAGMPLMPLWTLGLLLAVGVFVAIRVKKYLQVLAFLGTYFTLILVMALLHLGLPSATPADALRSPFVNSALFLGFFMLTDPPTTPGTLGQQIPFAAVSAAVAAVLFATVGGLTYLLIGLLAGNGLTALMARSRKPIQTTRPVERQTASGV